MLKNFFKSTFRSLWNNKVYSSLNIAGLSIGIACAGLIFLWAADEMTYDNINAEKDRLYNVKVNADFGGNKFVMESTPRLMAGTIKTEIPEIINACRVSDDDI